MITLRPYQSEAVSKTLRQLATVRRVCLVAPTGAGKTTMGAAVVAAHQATHRSAHQGHTVWLAHRDELLDQAQERVPPGTVVMSYQTALFRGVPACSLVVADECHHLSDAGDWRTVLPDGVPVLGLTATPQRGDGQPLGDVFQRMVVAAKYSELLSAGYLVPCEVKAPWEPGRKATIPSVAALCQGLPDELRGFVYVASVDDAVELARVLPGCAAVHANTPEEERRAAVEGLRSGSVRWLANVATMTEGTDVPGANCAIIARPIGTTGQWLQITGRVIRPAHGKLRSVAYDLCGSVWTHGSPTEDRKYSLRGDGISRPPSKRNVASVVVCLRCGLAYQGQPCCPSCGYHLVRNSRGQAVDLSSLVVAYSGGATVGVADQVEAWRAAGMHWREIRRRCRGLFGTAPVVPWAPVEDRRAEYESLIRQAESRGYALGWAAQRYRGIFGTWPGGG